MQEDQFILEAYQRVHEDFDVDVAENFELRGTLIVRLTDFAVAKKLDPSEVIANSFGTADTFESPWMKHWAAVKDIINTTWIEIVGRCYEDHISILSAENKTIDQWASILIGLDETSRAAHLNLWGSQVITVIDKIKLQAVTDHIIWSNLDWPNKWPMYVRGSILKKVAAANPGIFSLTRKAFIEEGPGKGNAVNIFNWPVHPGESIRAWVDKLLYNFPA